MTAGSSLGSWKIAISMCGISRTERSWQRSVLVLIHKLIGSACVRLPRLMAESAVAAWIRDELGEIGEESCDEFELRVDAAELALIGLAVRERGVRDGEEVV